MDMKLTRLKFVGIILFFSIFTCKVFSQENILNKTISIDFKNITIKEALIKIQKQNSIEFAYSDLDQLNLKVNGSFQNKTIKEILDNLLKNTSLEYKVIRGRIAIYKSKNSNSKQTVHGYIYDKTTGEVLIGATVYDITSYKGTISNQFGFFSLTMPSDEYLLKISFLGYNSQELFFADDAIVTIFLEPETKTMEEVVIKADKDDDFITASSMGITKVTAKNIQSIPSLAGESDMLKAITLLPGVKQGTDGSAGFYVRGGGPDQNLILLDGVPLYNPFHLWGYLSTFSADAINNVEIIKGAFPARYGGRLSSVVDVSMNDGNNKDWDKRVSIGLLSSKASLSGPIKKDTSAMFLSVRRTYLDLILVPVYAMIKNLDNSKTRTGYNFTDVNFKINYKFSNKNKWYLSAYWSRDILYNTKIEGGSEAVYEDKSKHNEGWGNGIVALRWNHLFSDKLFSNTTAYYTGYNYFFLDKNEVESKDQSVAKDVISIDKEYSRIHDFCLKQDYQYIISSKQSLRFGLGGITHFFQPKVKYFYYKSDEGEKESRDNANNIDAQELYLYIEDELEVNSFLRINGGLHATTFLVGRKTYTSIQPRFSGRIQLLKNLAIKGGYSQMAQFLHLLAESSLTQSSDLWVSTTQNIKPQKAELYSLGMAWFPKRKYQLEIEGYYKIMKNIIRYKDGYQFMAPDISWEEKVTVGEGESYGTEILLRKNKGNFTGWIGYTLSWTNRIFSDINNGDAFPYKFDRRHDISFTSTYSISENWNINLNWVYSTGMRISTPTASYINPYYNGHTYNWIEFVTPNDVDATFRTTGRTDGFSATNNYKLPDYHRLDITATWKKLTKRNNERELTFGLTNVYNRYNPTYYIPMATEELNNESTKFKYETITMFPLMPTFTYTINF